MINIAVNKIQVHRSILNIFISSEDILIRPGSCGASGASITFPSIEYASKSSI